MDNKAVSALLVAFIVGLLSMVLFPSDASRMATALSSRKVIVLQPVENFVERREVETIISAVERRTNFLVVEGGNRMGKTIAVNGYLTHGRCCGTTALERAQ